MTDSADKPNLFGRDRFLVEKVAKLVHKAASKEHDHTPLRETRRGNWFDLRLKVDGEWTGHIVRVTVELDHVEDPREMQP